MIISFAVCVYLCGELPLLTFILYLCAHTELFLSAVTLSLLLLLLLADKGQGQ